MGVTSGMTGAAFEGAASDSRPRDRLARTEVDPYLRFGFWLAGNAMVVPLDKVELFAIFFPIEVNRR